MIPRHSAGAARASEALQQLDMGQEGASRRESVPFTWTMLPSPAAVRRNRAVIHEEGVHMEA